MWRPSVRVTTATLVAARLCATPITVSLAVLQPAWSTSGAQAVTGPKITLAKGLRVDWAWRGDSVEGDFTPAMIVTQVNPAAVDIVAQAIKRKAGGGKENVVIDTRMLRSAMTDGRIYRQIWWNTDPLVMNGTTSMILPLAIMRDINTKGSASITIVDNTTPTATVADAMATFMRALSTDSVATGKPYAGTMKRVEPGTIPFAVLVNNHAVALPAIHLRGVLGYKGERYDSDMQVYADPAFPLVLAHTVPRGANGGHGGGGRVVSISYPDSDASKRMEDDLAAKRPVEVYDIYFDYNSAEIKPASDSVLQELGAIMRRHPDWKLSVTGHTDSIGGTGSGNRVLSERRAAAVKEALSSRYGVAADRLDIGGAGDSQPLATNATLEGRARNRRVELKRE
jgi:outer membrane protein OmpA-like peptidoglycan-associated protein